MESFTDSDDEVMHVSYPSPDSPIAEVTYSIEDSDDENQSTPFSTASPKRKSMRPAPEFELDDQLEDVYSPQKKPRVYVLPPGRRNRTRDKITLPSSSPTRTFQPDVDEMHEDFTDMSAEEPTQDYCGAPSPYTFEPESESGLQSSSFDTSYALFLESLDWDESMFTRLSNKLFIVNGWNKKKNEATSSQYHLSRTRAGSGVLIMCLCPSWELGSPCCHEKFLRDYGDLYFDMDGGLMNEDDRTFMFSRMEDIMDDTYINIFSVPTPGSLFDTIKNRAIVEHSGKDTGEGTWNCSKCPNAVGCGHISRARRSLQQYVKIDISAQDLNANDGSLEYNPLPVEVKQAVSATANSVSHLPLPPPVWARIQSDRECEVLPTMTSPPDLIRLDGTATCSCSRSSIYDPSKPVEQRPCIVYSLTRAFQSKIEVQRCDLCSRRVIGSDCRDLGLFNWNNRILFTHDLLDDYTSSFTASETPFAAWVLVACRRYLTRQSLDTEFIEFVKDKTFRAVWFSYIKLVRLENDMSCLKCGPSPDVAIFDGVTLAFSRRHLLATLRPPTTIEKNSLIKSASKPMSGLQCLPDKSLRKSIRDILSGPHLALPDVTNLSLEPDEVATDGLEGRLEQDEDDGEPRSPSKKMDKDIKKAKALLQRIDMIPLVVEKLTEINVNLGNLFKLWFGVDAVVENRNTPPLYRKLFLQMAAEENILQLINGAALHTLLAFIQDPSRESASNLVLVPAVYHVVNYELESGGLTPETKGLCSWLYKRAYAALQSIKHYGPPVKDDVDFEASDLWQETGACYGMPQIRNRPQYPSFPNDSGRDSAKKEMRGEGCNKFYAKYGESRLTGGIMCVWCTHSVCYGFHCIPSAEGRNDVFSALYTRWERAPRVAVYDFACALQPYCMAREPEFFANTLFAIDTFHSTGHTKCGHAAFLTTYCEANPLLLSVNSSAAECGNGGISRIRKSVSYMSQVRAILFTKVFISIWNRVRIQNMEKTVNRQY